MGAFYRRLCLLAALVGSLVSVAAAAQTRIGFANPLAGPYVASASRNRAAAEAAVGDLNRVGGVLGQRLALVAVDDGCGVEQAVRAAEVLVAADVRMVVGHMCSHSSLMAAAVYEAAGIVMISPDSTHPRLTEEGRDNIFRLVGRDDRQGRLAGDLLATVHGNRRIAILHDGSTYGAGLALQTRRRLREWGRAERLFLRYAPGAADHEGLAERLVGEGAEVVYVGGYGPDAARILLAVRARGSGLQLIGGDGLGMEEFAAIAGRAADGTIFSNRRDVRSSPAAAPVLAALRDRGLDSRPGGGGGLAAYAAIQVWAQAVERAGRLDEAEVVRTLRHGRFATVLGPVAFDGKGDLESADWEWHVWQGGDYRGYAPPVAMR